MTSYTYASLHTLLNITIEDYSALATEALIDTTLGLLTLEGAKIRTKMAGTAGSKTLTLTESEWAVVYYVARILYIDIKNKGQSVDTQGLSVTTRDFSTRPEILEQVRYYANKLKGGKFKKVKTF